MIILAVMSLTINLSYIVSVLECGVVYLVVYGFKTIFWNC